MTTSASHVILGAAGVAGRETAAALRRRGISPTAVVRTPRAGLPADGSLIAADLTDPETARAAVAEADVAYLTVGLPYSSAIWARDWPRLVKHVADGCLASRARLVYSDNVYAYGATSDPMTEQTPVRPISRKGAARAEALGILEDARRRGLELAVARSADFYGPGATTSAFNMFSINPAARGKSPTWLFDATKPHAMTYTPDIGDALAILGTDPRGIGTWHVPTSSALTGAEYLRLACGAPGKPRVMSNTVMRIGAIFSTPARETLEMSYQYTAPYLFDSSRFENTFSLAPSPYEQGIAATLAAARSAG